MARKKTKKYNLSKGSALILTVVLISLLAVVGAMFMMTSRTDRIATSALAENKELEFALETVVEQICEQLILDVPGVTTSAEYYDYPGTWDKWLAANVPYRDLANPDNYYWQQISDVTGYLTNKGFATQYVKTDPPGNTKVIREYPEITLDEFGELDRGKLDDGKNNNESRGQSADADGDGIADAKWFPLGNIETAKDKTIYAAVRIIDAGGMLNVNTAYKFDPNDTTQSRIDGSNQLQINLEALARTNSDKDKIRFSRWGNTSEPNDTALNDYLKNCVWKIQDPCNAYHPFDISDELELRYRYCISSPTYTRLENTWPNTLKPGYDHLYDASANYGLDDWKINVTALYDPNNTKADTRHFLTTYNIDRIIDPVGVKMLNINTADPNALYATIKKVLNDPNFMDDVNDTAAQLAVNLIDFHDSDSNVTAIDINGVDYYGFETPCIYISELAHCFKTTPGGGGPIGADTYRAYAIELFKPYAMDLEPNDPNTQWQLYIDNNNSVPAIGDHINIPIIWSGNSRFHIIRFQDPRAPNDTNIPDLPYSFKPVDPLAVPQNVNNTYNRIFARGSNIQLRRRAGSDWVIVDSHPVVQNANTGGWLIVEDGNAFSIQRDITVHKCIKRLWGDANVVDPTLGYDNVYFDLSDANLIQAHPENKPFTNTGEIGKVFTDAAYYKVGTPGTGIICSTNFDEPDVRLDLAKPYFQNLFQYLTVLDPSSDGINNDADFRKIGSAYPENLDESETNLSPEFKIPGRININTAPWYVIAQLPWVTKRNAYDSNALATAIVAYRDKQDLSLINGPDYYRGGVLNSRELETGVTNLRENPGFASIGELTTVINKDAAKKNYDIRYYALDSNDLTVFPDLTTDLGLGWLPPGDRVKDDFEERDVIFSRISNLVTVRSDVFIAYILVRIGIDGPQKRVIALLDRSNVYPDGKGEGGTTGKVKIIALQKVADPR